MALPAVLLTGLDKSLKKLTSTLEQSIDFSERANKASLALGMTYSETESSLGSNVDKLRGSLEDRLTANLRSMEAGLQGNTLGISRLINQQELTGGIAANTAKAFASLEAQLGASREDTNYLAESLIITSQE